MQTSSNQLLALTACRHRTLQRYVWNDLEMNDRLLKELSLLNLRADTAILVPRGSDWFDFKFEKTLKSFVGWVL